LRRFLSTKETVLNSLSSEALEGKQVLFLIKSCLITVCLSNIGQFRSVLVQELQVCLWW